MDFNFFPVHSNRQNSKPPPSKEVPDFYYEFCSTFLKTANFEFHCKLSQNESKTQNIATALFYMQKNLTKKSKRLNLLHCVKTKNVGNFKETFEKLVLNCAIEIWWSYERQLLSVYKKDCQKSVYTTTKIIPKSIQKQNKISNRLQALKKLAQFGALSCVNYLTTQLISGRDYPHESILDCQLTNKIMQKYPQKFTDWLYLPARNGTKWKLSVQDFYEFPAAAFTQTIGGIKSNVISREECDVRANAAVSAHRLRRPFDFEWSDYVSTVGNSHVTVDPQDYFLWNDPSAHDLERIYDRFLGEVTTTSSKFEEIVTVLYQTLSEMEIDIDVDLKENSSLAPNYLKTQQQIVAHLENHGKFAQAFEIYREIYNFQLNNLPENHPDIVQTRLNMAAVLDSQGDYAQALSVYKEVYEIQTTILGAQHHDTLTTQNYVAFVLRNQGKFEEALEVYQKVYEIESQTLGPRHGDTLTTENNMASLLQSQGKYEQAYKVYDKVYQIRKRKFGGDHPQTLLTKNNLAAVLCDQGRYGEAEEIYRKVYKMSVKILGYDHPSSLTTRQSLAIALKQQGEHVTAMRILWEVYERCRLALGEEHSLTLSTKNFMDLYDHHVTKIDK